MAFIEITINDAVKKIARNAYLLPSIQREYVWKAEQITALFDSVMMGYPIGSFMFWQVGGSNKAKFKFYEFLRYYHETDKCRHDTIADTKGTRRIVAVLDGQQRLTSLYIGLKGSYAVKKRFVAPDAKGAFPVKELYLNLLIKKTENEDGADEGCTYNFRFLKKEEVKNDANHHWFRVGDILDYDITGTTKYVNQNVKTGDMKKKALAKETLRKLWKVIREEKPISYYLETSDKLDEVLKIFVRANQGGTPLSYSDMLLSTAAAEWKERDARKEINDAVTKINNIGKNGNFRVNKDFILKACLVLCDCPVVFRMESFKPLVLQKIERELGSVVDALVKAGDLAYRWGFDKDSIVSNNLLIPIAYYIKHARSARALNNNTNKERMRKWFVYALLKRVFSGQSDTALRNIREILRNNKEEYFPLERIVKDSKGTRKTLEFSRDEITRLIDEVKYGDADCRAVMSVLYSWPDTGLLYHIDHIFPKSKFSKQELKNRGIDPNLPEFSESCFNSLANLQFLEGRVNIAKQNRDFVKWLSKHKHAVSFRRRQFIPNVDLSFENFPAFLEARKKLIIEKLEGVLKDVLIK